MSCRRDKDAPNDDRKSPGRTSCDRRPAGGKLAQRMLHAPGLLRRPGRGENKVSYIPFSYHARQLGMLTFQSEVPIRSELGLSTRTRARTSWMTYGVSTWDGAMVLHRHLSGSSVVMPGQGVRWPLAHLPLGRQGGKAANVPGLVPG